jgi:hypothetical protein
MCLSHVLQATSRSPPLRKCGAIYQHLPSGAAAAARAHAAGGVRASAASIIYLCLCVL